MTPNNQDIQNITWLIGEKIQELSEKFYNALSYGSDSKDCLKEKILLLRNLQEIVSCYNPDLTDEENCFSQTEIEQLLYYISTTYNIYFPPYEGQNTVESEIFDDSFDITFN